MNAYMPHPGALAMDQQTGTRGNLSKAEPLESTPEGSKNQPVIPAIIKRHFSAAELAGVS